MAAIASVRRPLRTQETSEILPNKTPSTKISAAAMLMAALLGAIGGVASYTAGTRLTEVAFGYGLYGPIIIGLLWAALFPGLLELAAVLSRAEKTDDNQS